MTTKHVMLSYQWGSQDLVRRVYNSLSNGGYNVWLDIEGGINGDINDCMAYAVENSAVIVCFLTEKYECSVNCKRELSYADRMGIVIIPLIVERYRENGETFSPCGWLGILTATLHYISLSSNDSNQQFEKAMQALFEKLELIASDKRHKIYARQASLSRKLIFPSSTCPQLTRLPHSSANYCNNSPFLTPHCPDETEFDVIVNPMKSNFQGVADSTNPISSFLESASRKLKEKLTNYGSTVA